MASFTDNTQQLGNFNPYIQQLPVDAMVHVGTQKQKAYDAGVEKIQNNIDNIAGMDVIRDVDKAYLQSKVNELSSNLRTVAAGDFSNFQLVNSVSGMTNNIAKDKNVQNAVSSTMRLRKEQAAQELANKEGKGSISNDWDFDNQTSSWLNSSDVKQAFTGKYTPYTNYKKNALEVIKSLTKDESITDNDLAFDSKGNLVIADAITRTKLAGISPEKIQQALLSTLTPNDFKQMEIDGRYNYASIPPEQFVNRINNSFKEKYDSFQNQKDVLINAMDSTSSVQEKNILKQQVDAIDKTLSNIKGEYDNVSQTFADGDVESAKARLHTADFMNGFSKAFSYTQTSQTKETSPVAQMQMERQKLNQDWKMFSLNLQQDERFHNDDVSLKREANEIARTANKLKKQEIEGYGGFPSPVDQSTRPKIDLNTFKSTTEATIQDLENRDKAYYENKGKSKQWFDQQYNSWKQRPGSVDPLVNEYFTSRENKAREVQSNLVMLSDLQKKATKKHGDIYSKISPEERGLIFTTSKGDRYNYSPKEFVDFNEKFFSIKKVTASTRKTASGEYDTKNIISFDQEAIKRLSPKEKELFNIYLKKDQGKPLYPAEKVMIDKAEKMNKAVNIPFKNTIRQIKDDISKGLQDRLSASQGVEYGIPLGKAEQKADFQNVLLGALNLAKKQNGSIAGSDIDVGVLSELVNGVESATIFVVEGTQAMPAMYELTASGKKGTQTIRITPKQKQAIFGNRWDSSLEVKNVAPYLEQIRKMGGTTTGWNNKDTSISNAYLGKTDFPNTGQYGYGVSGNIVTQTGDSYSIRLNIFDPESGQWRENIPYPRSGTISKEQLNTAMKGLSDAAIYEILHEQPATINDLKRVKQYSQNPFPNAR